MPQLDKPLHELKSYAGTNPRPADFDAYWTRALQELDATPPQAEFVPVEPLGDCNAELYDLYFTGVGGARIHAKYAKPKGPRPPGPAVLQFHGYGGSSGEWVNKLGYVHAGFTVATLDCRGQGAGISEDNLQVTGNTREGHLLRGLHGPADKILFRYVFLDTVQLARIVLAQPDVNPERVGAMGGSQGGGLTLACAALEPRIKRAAPSFPFLSDYQRVWQMDLAKDAYVDIREFFRRYDPQHAREDELFQKLGYIDIQHLAPRIRAEVLMGISLMDPICPPSTQFAVYNKITSKKDSVIYYDFGHENLPGFDDQSFRFMMGLKI